MTLIETLTLALDSIDPSLSVQHANARQHLTFALRELAQAPTEQSIAIARLLAEYAIRRQGRYTVREGVEISFAGDTPRELSGMLPLAQVLVAQGRGSDSLWLDDEGRNVSATAQEVVDNATAYTAALAEIEVWVQAKRNEIEASDDPLAVDLKG